MRSAFLGDAIVELRRHALQPLSVYIELIKWGLKLTQDGFVPAGSGCWQRMPASPGRNDGPPPTANVSEGSKATL